MHGDEVRFVQNMVCRQIVQSNTLLEVRPKVNDEILDATTDDQNNESPPMSMIAKECCRWIR